MKKLFLSVIAALFMTTAFANANYPNPVEKAETNKELSELLNKFPPLNEIYGEVLIKVQIVLNEKHEIIVVGTNTTDNVINNYIKNSLEGEKLFSDELKIGEDFLFGIKFMNN